MLSIASSQRADSATAPELIRLRKWLNDAWGDDAVLATITNSGSQVWSHWLTGRGALTGVAESIAANRNSQAFLSR
jgi:hypothetical protein